MSAVVELQAIGKAFGAAPVLRHIDLTVQTGEMLGLIGPNGAGKTTLFNVMSGYVSPDGGCVRFDGEDVTPLAVAERARRGLVRSFQKSLVFGGLSVRENVALARRAHRQGYRWWGSHRAMRQSHTQADAALHAAGLHARADTLAAALSYGEQRVLDVVIALAQQPRVLLLDEPTAGLSEREAEQLLALIARRPSDTAVVLVSHDIDIVMRVCDRIAVLDLGVLIATGTPQTIRADARVIAAYLGVPQRAVEEAGT